MAFNKEKRFYARPRDRTLQGYKDWVLTIGRKLVGDSFKDDLSEQQWIDKWQDFWTKTDQGKAETDERQNIG